MKKLFLSLLLAATAGLAFGQTQADVVACIPYGQAAYSAATAKQQGMTQEEFDEAMVEFQKQDLPPHVKRAAVKAFKRGFANPVTKDPVEVATEVFDECVKTKV